MRIAGRFATLVLLMLLVAMAAGCSGTTTSTTPPSESSATTATAIPNVINLPNGFRPEGIWSLGDTIFVGSIPTGAVYRADINSGTGAILVAGKQGRAAIGLKVDDKGRLVVAGGPTGKAFVYDAANGADKAEYTLTAAKPTFVNDVVLTGDAAWFTDSQAPVLYRVSLPADGSVAGEGAVSTLKLTGDFKFQPGVNNMNGIAWTGQKLICVQSSTGKLFTVDPTTGVTAEIDLGGQNVENGDGLLLEGQTLYVVQNRKNMIAVVDLAPDFASGTVRTRISDPQFDVPTTITSAGTSFYLPNARFSTTPTPDTTYTVVRVDRP